MVGVGGGPASPLAAVVGLVRQDGSLVRDQQPGVVRRDPGSTIGAIWSQIWRIRRRQGIVGGWAELPHTRPPSDGDDECTREWGEGQPPPWLPAMVDTPIHLAPVKPSFQ